MPVFAYEDGSLRISTHYPQDVRADQVHASSLASGAYSTCTALAQLPVYAGAEDFPAKVLEIYGSSETIAAFALLGWLRGRELSILDDVQCIEKPATYSTPRRKRTWWLRDGVVYEKGVAVGMFNGSALPTTPDPIPVRWDAPLRTARKASKPSVSVPQSKIHSRAEHAIITKASLKVLTPEVRAIVKALPEHQWVGKTVEAVCGYLTRKSPVGARAATTELMGRLCWIPESQKVTDIGL